MVNLIHVTCLCVRLCSRTGYLKVMPYDRSSYCRLSEDHEAKMKSADADRLSRIRGMIGSDFKLIADVAQGEPAVLIKPKVEGEKKLEWYGFIRLMVFSKLGTWFGGVA